MKKNILLVSLGAAGVATILGVGAVLSQNFVGSQADMLTAITATTRLYQLAGISGLFSIGSFFVGLAYPTTSTVTSVVEAGGLSETRKVINS